MKKITKIALIACSAIVLYSCDNESATGYSTIDATPNVTGSVDANDVETLTEGESFPLVINIDEPQVVDIHVKIKLVSATADPDHDFEYPSEIVIPAYTTSAQALVKTAEDCDFEGTKDFTLEIGDITTSNASIPVKTVKFNILNKLGTDLELDLAFNKSFVYGSSTYNLCQIGYDMDFLIFDADYNDTEIYDAATGDCIEDVTITEGRLANGTYYIYGNLYDNAGVEIVAPAFNIPVTVSYFKCGSGTLDGNYVQEVDEQFMSDAGNGAWSYVATLVVDGSTYTLKDGSDAVIVSGKSSANANKITAAFAKQALRKK